MEFNIKKIKEANDYRARIKKFIVDTDNLRDMSIPALVEPPVRSLRATLPAAKSHYSGGGNHHSGN